MDAEKIKQAVAIGKSLTNGGRALNAVWNCDKVDTEEKIILLYLGSQLDFTGDFTEALQRNVSTIMKKTGIKGTTVFSRLSSLEEKGYIERKNKTLSNGSLGANEYYLTDLIFNEYYVELVEKGSSPAERGVVRPADGGSSPAERGVVRPADGGSSPAEHYNPSSSSPSSSNPNFKSKTLAGNSAPKRSKLRMDILYKSMRQCYLDKTPGEITRGIVLEMLQACNGDRERVLEIIKREASIQSGMIYTPTHDAKWLAKLNHIEPSPAQDSPTESKRWDDSPLPSDLFSFEAGLPH